MSAATPPLTLESLQAQLDALEHPLLNLTSRIRALEANPQRGDSIAPNGSTINSSGLVVPAGEPLLAPAPNGVDDTAALQTWLNTNVGQRHYFPASGGKPYKVKEPLNVPAESWVEGSNWANVEIERIGSGDTFRLAGDVTMRNIYVRASAKQANGAVFDFSHFNASGCTLENIILGSNLWIGFNLVAEAGLESFGNIHISKVIVQEPGSRVKSWGSTVFQMGSTAKRTVVVFIDDVYIASNTTADLPNAFKIANTDSLRMHRVIVQNAGVAFNIGEGDESALRTTNYYLLGLQADGCTTGFKLAGMLERGQILGGSAEACTNGIVWGELISGLGLVGFNASKIATHGINILGSASPEFQSRIVGCDLTGNGTSGEAGMAGINFAEASGGIVVSGCSIGNPLLSTKQQKVGIAVAKKCKAITIIGNDFFHNGIGANFTNAGETEHVPANEAALEATNTVR